MMVNFGENIGRLNRTRLVKLHDWFTKYTENGLIGDHLDPDELRFDPWIEPTISGVSNIDDIEILEATYLGHGLVEAGCEVTVDLEFDLNDDGDNSERIEARMEINLRVDLREQEITGHHLHRVYPIG